jgi:glyoxylase-like metal-dependent hydrolase (beta-lactamase superfamily II)
MKKLLIVSLLSISLFGFDYNLKPKQVSDNVWCFFGKLEGPNKANGGNMVNTCYIATDKSFVVFDSGPTYEYARQAYEQMSKIKPLKVNTVIASHDHDDHWLGNSFYKEKFGAKIVGIKPGEEVRMFDILSKDAIKNTKIIDVDKYIQKSTSLNIDGKKFEVIALGYKAHTQEDIFVYLPSEKVLFASDLVMNGRITSNRHGSVLGQIKAIEKINTNDWEVLIPGHGFIIDKTAADEAKLYFKLLKERVKKAIEDGADATDVTEIVKMDEFKDKAMFKGLNKQNILEAFNELEFADEDEE